jgi:hypothetical protein
LRERPDPPRRVGPTSRAVGAAGTLSPVETFAPLYAVRLAGVVEDLSTSLPPRRLETVEQCACGLVAPLQHRALHDRLGDLPVLAL